MMVMHWFCMALFWTLEDALHCIVHSLYIHECTFENCAFVIYIWFGLHRLLTVCLKELPRTYEICNWVER